MLILKVFAGILLYLCHVTQGQGFFGGVCSAGTSLCMNNITQPEPDLQYGDIGLSVYSPSKWIDICQQYTELNVSQCLSDVVSMAPCKLEATTSQARVRDMRNAYEFRCSQEALDIYSSNWHCFQDRRFETGWSSCLNTHVRESVPLIIAVGTATNPIRLSQLLQQYCSSFQTYLACVYSAANVYCSQTMAYYVYKMELEPNKNYLRLLSCNVPTNISDMMACHPQTAKLCISKATSDVKVLSTQGNVQRMCDSIDGVESDLSRCYGENTARCEAVVMTELDLRRTNVHSAIAKIKQLCNSPTVPSFSECPYQKLIECEQTLTSALRLDTTELCGLREDFLSNYTSCIESLLTSCHDVTKTPYRDLEKQTRQLWWNSASNYSCLLAEPCVQRFMENMDQVKSCFEVNVARETFAEICRDYQIVFSCVDTYIKDCKSVVKILDRESLLDQVIESSSFYGCNITFSGISLVTSPNSCNYRKVLKCYEEFFQVIGIKKDEELRNLHNISPLLLNAIKTDPAFCSQVNAANLRHCLDMSLPQCDNFTEANLGHMITRDAYQPVLFDNNKILSYNLILDVESLCTAGCQNTGELLRAVESCSLQGVSLSSVKDNINFHQFTSQYVNKTAMERSCRALKAYIQCVVDKGGDCAFVRHYYLDFKPYITTQQLQQHCNVTINPDCLKAINTCISPVVQGVTIPELTFDAINSSISTFSSELEAAVIKTPEVLCRSLWHFDPTDRSQCVRRQRTLCVYGQLYTDQYMAWISAVGNVVESMCVEECSNLTERHEALGSHCQSHLSMSLAQIIKDIKDNWILNISRPQQCRKLKRFDSCVREVTGLCPYLVQLENRNFYNNLIVKEAMSICSSISTAEATTVPQTAEAPDVQINFAVFTCAVLITMLKTSLFDF